MNVALLLAYIFLLTARTKCAIFSKEQEDGIAEIVKSLMECKNIPGLTVAVVNGSETWTKGFGMADLDSGREVEDETMFVIGSLGKAFTVALLGSLLEGTRYDWTTRLADIKGLNLQFIDDNMTREATLDDLLSHQTGLWDIVDFGFIAGYPEGTTIEILSSRLKYIPQKFTFRHPYFVYNNAMYMILGHVIEVLGHDTWSNLMTSRNFEPLGMTKTKLMSREDDVEVGNVAKPYIMPGKVMVNGTTGLYKITPLEPAGGVLSSAVDMAKWIRFNLNHGKTQDGRKLVDRELFDEAFKKHRGIPLYAFFKSIKNPPFPVDSLYNGYGYGWYTSTYRGFNRVSHTGGFFSYVSSVWLFPDRDIGLFVTVNGPGKPDTSDVANEMISYFLSDLVLGFEPWLNHSTACAYPAPWKPRRDMDFEIPPKPVYTNGHLDDFIGHYGSPLLPDITIDFTKDRRQLRLIWNRIEGELIPADNSSLFEFKMTAPWEFAVEMNSFGEGLTTTFPVQFIRDSVGDVQSFNFSLGDTAVMQFQKGVCFPHACKVKHGGSVELNGGNRISSGSLLLPVFGAMTLTLFLLSRQY